MLDAYTIKKMLPRLIIAVILIQFSFYIASALIDISNILGVGLKGLLEGISRATIDLRLGALEEILGVGGLAFGIAATITGTIFLVIVPVILAVLGVLFTLTFRNILIVILVIASPIAFAAWVLPGTEKFFKIWWDFLSKALLMFPLITLLFAASSLAAVVATDRSSLDQSPANTLLAIVAIIAPLALVPFTFKFARSAIAAFSAGASKLQARVWGGADGKGGLRKGIATSAARRQRDLRLGMGAGWNIAGREVRIGRGTVGSWMSQPWKLTSRGLARGGFEGLGADVEAAGKQLKERGIDSLPAAQMIVGGRDRYEKMRREAKSGQERADLDTIWAVASQHTGDTASVLAATSVIGEAGASVNSETWSDVRKRFGDHPLGSKAWTDLSLGSLPKNPHLKSVNYNTGQIEAGKTGTALESSGVDRYKDFTPDAIAHALRDKYDYDGGADNFLSTAKEDEMLASDKVSGTVKQMIRDARATHAAGGSIEGYFTANGSRYGIRDPEPFFPPAPPSGPGPGPTPRAPGPVPGFGGSGPTYP